MLVVVDTDPSLQRAVVRVAAAAGLEVVACATARAAFNACGALAPDCLVVAVSPSDHEGFWLLAALRARPDEACSMPLIALAAREPGAHAASLTRIQALEAGADVVLQRPIETSELVAQVKALTKMAARVVVRRGVLSGADVSGALTGDLDLDPVSDVLRKLEARRWSGSLHLGDRGFASRVLSVDLAEGALLGGRLGARWLAPVDALREALGWTGRRFELVAAPPPSGFRGAPSLGELLHSVLFAPNALPLGARADDDLPEVSPRRRSPSPRVESAFPGANSAHPAAVTAASMSMSIPAASPSRPSGRGVVESVQPGARPDPRAERER
jgi:DNA-binding response OmpR family regulator